MEETRPQIERNRAWLNRYRESLNKQKRLAETLHELRSRSTSICVPLCTAKSAPTGSHADHVADSVQRIAEIEKRLRAEQMRGQEISLEIIDVVFAQLPLNYAQVLAMQYVELLDSAQTAQKLSLCKSTVTGYRRAALAALNLPENAL